MRKSRKLKTKSSTEAPSGAGGWGLEAGALPVALQGFWLKLKLVTLWIILLLFCFATNIYIIHNIL